MKSKKGQVTIFIIIAIVIFAAFALFFLLRGGTSTLDIPSSLEAPYTAFLSCLEDEALLGIELMESQGGYIDLPDFEPGSNYMPFSSQLNFVGINIPYWYYVSAGNLQKEQVPTIESMQVEIGRFVSGRVSNCDLNEYLEQGFEISQEGSGAKILIRDDVVQVDAKIELSVSKGEDSFVITDHKVVVSSKLGSLYKAAKRVYDKEQSEMFLENYGIDILRLYAPVDGVEISCGPLVWNAEEVFDELEEAIEVNTQLIKTRGDSKDYYVIDLGVKEEVRFLNSRSWSNSFEVLPSEGPILISSPVGNQPGMGILGFCYVPYHFVYNIGYPVLVQVRDGDEIFQFPIAVVIQGNKPREALSSSFEEPEIPEFCKYKNTPVEVSTYDIRINSVDADIYYECANTNCYIGATEEGKLNADFPQCVNGRIIARAEGYRDARYLFSTNQGGRVDVVLDKLYPIEINLKINGRDYDGEAVVSFASDRATKTIFYPEQKAIELSEGENEVQVYIYEPASLTLGASVQEECIEVPKGGLGGIIGLTEERCFEVEIPEQVISNALTGGGKQTYFFLANTLESSSVAEINVQGLPEPASIEQLQLNYVIFDNRGVDLEFK